MTENGQKIRLADSAEMLVFYTDTDQSDYPIYILPSKEVIIKKRMQNAVATFYVKTVIAFNKDAPEFASIVHPLLEKAIEAIKEVSRREPYIEKMMIQYEVYKGMLSRIVGEAKTYVIKVLSESTPYSGEYDVRRAFAIAYTWKERIVAKIPELSKYTYVTSTEDRRGRKYVKVAVKLPIVSQELESLFNSVVMHENSIDENEIEKQIRDLQELIRKKEDELQVLRQQFENLKMKLQLEKMKKQVI